jgi:hypothetical protein
MKACSQSVAFVVGNSNQKIEQTLEWPQHSAPVPAHQCFVFAGSATRTHITPHGATQLMCQVIAVAGGVLTRTAKNVMEMC